MKLLSLVLLLLPCLAYSQDTMFYAKHNFSAPVRNVFTDGKNIYVKAGKNLYKKNDNEWDLQVQEFTKTYVFFEKDFYETDYLPNQYLYDCSPMTHLIPQQNNKFSTIAQIDNRLFLATGGSLFEYTINNYYRYYYPGYSIRHIYQQEGLKVLSTYSGIFINDTIKAKTPYYSSGDFCKIKDEYYLCSDQLYRLNKDFTFERIPSAVNLFSGQSRKLIEFGHKLYAENTKSINLVDSNFELMPIHQGFEYYDLEAVDSVLLFSTYSGEIFAYNGNTTRLLCKINSRVRDIYAYKNVVYFSSDNGVYTITNLQPESLKLLTNTPFSVMVVIDLLKNTWIATENGLYLLPDKGAKPILFIANVEFNRGALTYYNDNVYAGSINGLYVINAYTVIKDYLPQYLNNLSTETNTKRKKWLTIGILALVAASSSIYLLLRKKKQKPIVTLPQKEEVGLTLNKIEQDIKSNNILTVENLAEFYKTNTVQLNRQFKIFDTTPGKFLKKVKIDYAKALLEDGISMEEVSNKVGYSASLLKKELG